MSKILQFSQADKIELGMHVPVAPKMGQSLVNFLMGSADEEEL